MTSETLKDHRSKQTSLLEDFHANHFQEQESKEEKMMTVTSGMKLLELLPKQNQDGLLEKMLMELLTSTMVQSCSRYKKIWKKRVSKSNVLLFQLQASVRGIKEKEFGLLATPNTMDHLPPRSKEGTLKLQNGHRKGRRKPCNLREQVDPQTMALYPTPSASCQMDVVAPPETVTQNSKGWSVTRKGTGTKFGAKLNDVVNKLYMTPTPTAHDSKNVTFPKSQTGKSTVVGRMLKNNQVKAGGKLNPNFVEFLMAYPTNWTKIEQTELNHSETQ